MTAIEAIQTGLEEAFQEVYHAHKDKLYFYFLSKTASSDVAQELVQQTFIKLWIHRLNLRKDLALEIQIFRIGRTTMIDLLRKKATERRAMSHLLVAEADHSLTENQLEKETRQKIRQILSQLPPMGRRAFTLSREQGLTYNEIARELSISPKTVEYHISKAISLLKKAIFLLVVFLPH